MRRSPTEIRRNALSVGTLIFLGTISVLVARHKAVMARVSEKKLSSVLEHMSEGVMLIDAKGERVLPESRIFAHSWLRTGRDGVHQKPGLADWLERLG
jgi:signal transduction histidine kinase